MERAGDVLRAEVPLPHRPAPESKRAEWSEEQAEAMRLATLEEVGLVKASISDGLAALHVAERDNDFQGYVGGLRKLILAGMQAKVLADWMLERYGPEAASL